MAFWAGIDEAGYGPVLGPLVVAATAFNVPGPPREGRLWELLGDSVSRTFEAADGRLIVNDSKCVYTPARGIRALEEGVLVFLGCRGGFPATASELLSSLLHPACEMTDGCPWCEGVRDIPLPLESNTSALASKAAVLGEALRRSGVELAHARASIAQPLEFNRVVRRTGNKALLLFQKSGLLLQGLWEMTRQQEVFVLVDRHGGRRRYRRLLRDVFPHCECDVVREELGNSVYRLRDRQRIMWVAFKDQGDSLALPVSLASMVAKYVRELYMRAFNAYWQGRMAGLAPTAGYARDGRRFLRDIAPVIERDGLDPDGLVRGR